MSRRSRWFLSVALAVGCLWTVVLSLTSCSRDVGRPNALLIVLGATRTDALGCYGGSPALTKNMDALAERGVQFQEAVAHSPYALGSIATIVTSLPPDLHGIKSDSGFRLSSEAVTLAEVFQEEGYSTAAFVSGSVVSGATGLSQGFDVYDDDVSMLYLINDAQYLPLQESLTGRERRGDETVERALRWLKDDRPRARPFFLMVHLLDPEKPYDPPPPFPSPDIRNPYVGEVAFADSMIGLLLDGLRDEGLEGKTVVSVVSSHGEAFREHGEVGHGFLLYETTLHVPWILAGPRIPKVKVQGPTGLVRVAPTILAACGMDAPGSFQGTSLLPSIESATAGEVTLPEEPIYLETYFPRANYRWSELLGWRSGGWKYIRGPRPELFHLESDPEEFTNLLDSEEAKARELSSQLDAYLGRETQHRLNEVIDTSDVKRWERLRSLGLAGDGVFAPEVTESGWEMGLPDPKDEILPWNRRQDAMGFYRVGLSLFHAGKYDESLMWANNAILADSTHLNALLLRCKSLAGLDRHEEAVRHYRSLLQLRPEDESAWIGVGISLDRIGRWQEAKTAFESALLVNVDSPEANFNLGALLFRNQRFADALPYYERVRELEPDNVPLRADLALLHLRLHQPDEAIEILKEGHAVDPRHPATLLLLGRLQIERGDVDEGRRMLESFLEHYPDSPDAERVREFLGSLEGS